MTNISEAGQQSGSCRALMSEMAHLEYGFELDRDGLLHLASTIRQIYWSLSVFFILPTVVYVLVYRTQMDRDCKIAFVIHNMVMACFDVYSGFFYQLYTLLPYPVLCCTGVLCNENNWPRMLLAILAFWTIAMCVLYLFVMMRMHQKMLTEESPLKMSNISQAFLIVGFSIILVSNVYGFAAWSIESSDKNDILKIPSIAWVTSKSQNILALGRQYTEILECLTEVLIPAMYLLLFTITVCFSYYVAITYHAVFRISKQFKTIQRSRTYQLQLRFMIWMSIQAFFTCIMFILPLAFLFISLITPLAEIFPVILMAPLRFALMVMYSCCSIGHSAVFLLKSTWFMQTFTRMLKQSKPSEAKSFVMSSSSSKTVRRL